jgi:DNA repair protein RadC
MSNAEGHRARLKARFLETGGAGVADYELLELALTFAIPRRDVKPIAKQLLKTCGSLQGVLNASPAELKKIEGMGEHSIALVQVLRQLALRVGKAQLAAKPVLDNRLVLLDYLYTRFASSVREEVVVLYLNSQLHLLAEETLFMGTLENVSASPREVLKRALEHNAAGLILAHNHPNGAPKPSQADIHFTTQLQKAALALGLELHDHLIIGAEAHYSFKAAGQL